MFGPIKLLYYMMCANSYVSDMGYEEKRKKKEDAFEICCWRRLLRIPWTGKGTNASIFMEINKPSRLSKIVCTRIARFLGHVQHRDPDNLEYLGKRPRCKIKRSVTKHWTDHIKEVNVLIGRKVRLEADCMASSPMIVRSWLFCREETKKMILI